MPQSTLARAVKPEFGPTPQQVSDLAYAMWEVQTGLRNTRLGKWASRSAEHDWYTAEYFLAHTTYAGARRAIRDQIRSLYHILRDQQDIILRDSAPWIADVCLGPPEPPQCVQNVKHTTG